jgi:hypothetical protein
MKHFVHFAAALAILATSGCLMPEKIETRVRYRDNGAPPEVTTIYHNISSDAKNDEDLRKDFDDLISDWTGDHYLVEQVKEGLIVKDRQIYIEKGRLQAKMLAIPAEGNFFEDMMISRGERIVVVKAEDAEIVETNAKILRTEQNYILVWPLDLKEIYWTQRWNPDPEDRTRCERNRPKLIKMFEVYKQKGN